MKETLRRLLHPLSRQFLHDHPEWEDEVRFVEIDGVIKPAFTTNLCLVFATWLKDHGGDAVRCDRFIKGFSAAIEEHFGRQSP